jgi:propanol-preferring alcohol dehydrogenase
MIGTMQAAVVEAFGKPLVLKEVAIPTPGAGQILVKTEACGVCHTDLHAADGDWPLKPAPPFIPGHEAIGRVVALGAGVTNVKEGDRVGVPWLYSACGHCEYCLTAWEPICPHAEFGGYTQNGGFAEYLLADPNYVARIPDGLTAQDAAPLICAGITTYKGIKRSPVSGSRFPVAGDSVISRFSMRSSWGSTCARSMLTTLNSRSQRSSVRTPS